jgi:hypothetical protein
MALRFNPFSGGFDMVTPVTVGTTAGTVAAGNDSRFGTVNATVNGESVTVDDLACSPGITEQDGALHLYEGGQGATFVAFAGDGSTTILDVVIPDLAASSEYTATLSVRVIFKSAATNAIVGSVDFSVDLYVVTDGAGVATATFQTTPSPDPSRLPATMAQATCTAAAIAGGFRISASRHPGYNSLARAFWWVTEWIEL